MPNTLLLKRRTADATAPTAGQLTVGELAFNAVSGILYGKLQSGTVVTIGSGGTGANPSALVGLAAVNGSATTYMRSDAAPALDQSIAPTWTGLHTFQASKLGLQDTNASHVLLLNCGSDLTANRALTLATGDAARTITLSGNPTLADWFDQSVKVAATPQFTRLALGTTDDAKVNLNVQGTVTSSANNGHFYGAIVNATYNRAHTGLNAWGIEANVGNVVGAGSVAVAAAFRAATVSAGATNYGFLAEATAGVNAFLGGIVNTPIGASSPSTGQFTDLAAASPMAFRNAIINGDMTIDQRNAGAAVNLTATVTYNQDRWACFAGATASGTLQAQQVAGDGASAYALRLSRTSGTFTSYLAMVQAIESVNCYRLAGKTVTVSFRARKGSAYTGTSLAAYVRTGTGTDQGAAGAVAGTWTGYASSTLSLTGTLGTSFSTFYASVSIPSGTTEIALMIATGNFVGTGAANDHLEITDVQVELGSLVTPYEKLPIDYQLRQCERYCEVWDNRGGGAFTMFATGMAYSDTQAYIPIAYRTRKRAVPAITAVNVTLFGVTNSAGSVNVITTLGASWKSTTNAHLGIVIPSLFTAGDATCLAAGNSTSPYLVIDAEI